MREVSVNEQTTRTDAGDRLLSIREIQELLGVSRGFVRKIQDRGELPYSRFGKLRKSRLSDVNAYVSARRVTPEDAG